MDETFLPHALCTWLERNDLTLVQLEKHRYEVRQLVRFLYIGTRWQTIATLTITSRLGGYRIHCLISKKWLSRHPKIVNDIFRMYMDSTLSSVVNTAIELGIHQNTDYLIEDEM